MSAREAELRALADRGAAELDGATAAELLAWVDTHFAGDYVVAANMADAVLIDLATTVRPGVDVYSSTPATTSPKPSAPVTRSGLSTASTSST